MSQARSLLAHSEFQMRVSEGFQKADAVAPGGVACAVAEELALAACPDRLSTIQNLIRRQMQSHREALLAL